MRQTLFTLVVRMVGVLIGLISSVATARYLGPEGRGLFYFWATVAALVVQFGNLGLHASNVYMHARRLIPLSILLANSLVVGLFAGLVIPIVLFIYLVMSGHREDLDVLLIGSIGLLSAGGLISLLGSNLLVAMNRLTEFNMIELATRIVSLLFLLVALQYDPNPVTLLAALGIAGIFAAGGLVFRLNSLTPVGLPSWNVFLQGLPYGLRAYAMACIATLVARMNAFLLEPVISPADYGAWSIASQIYDVLVVVPSSIALVLLPKIMRAKEPRRMVRANALLTGAVMTALAMVILLVGRPLVVWLYGHEFERAIGYLAYGVPGLVALSIISVLSQYLASIGFPRLLILIWLVVAMLHGAIASIVVGTYGADGAMASQSVAYIVGLLLMLLLIRQKNGQHA